MGCHSRVRSSTSGQTLHAAAVLSQALRDGAIRQVTPDTYEREKHISQVTLGLSQLFSGRLFQGLQSVRDNA